MGLLDNLMMNSDYGGQTGGLLDFLRTSQMQNNQYQPSAGFAPQEAPSSFAGRFDAAQNMAPPLSIGGYQMPRMGDATQFAGNPAALPQNAQDARGQMPQNGQAPQGQMPTDVSAQSRQQPDAAPQALPPAFGGGAGSALGRMFNPDGIVARLTGNDSRSMAQQNLKAQYDSLVPTLGPQKAMLAVMNPEAGKILIAQALEKHQYAFTKLDDGTIVRQDPMTGRVEPAYQATPKAEFGVINEQDGQKTYGWIDKNKRSTSAVAGAEPRAGSITGPDGKQIAIPEGVDRKTFVNEVSRAGAKAAAGEKTEVQAKSEKFGNKMENAEKNLSGIEGEGQSYKGRALESAPVIGGTMATNWAQSDNYQKYKQARDNFITALLRDESGAAIGTSEFQRYEKELFPQPGEGAGVIAQKKEARRIAIEAMKKSAGPGYKSPATSESEPSSAKPADPLGIR